MKPRLCLTVVAALLALAMSAAPAVAKQDPPAPVIPERYLTQAINWSTCSFDAVIKGQYPAAPTTMCAEITAPMDWRAPNAHPDIKVAIAYSRATGTSRGLMTTNPGGPGGAGRTLSAALALSKPRLFEDYDLLGFDPRGFGAGTRLQCLTTTEKLELVPTTPDYRRRDRRTHVAELADALLLADACSSTEFGRFVSSQQTVYDMELLRALMAAPRLNFIGYSYGTWLGGWYADTYPERVDRFLLDSNMDWTHTQWENVNFDPFSFQRRRDTQLFAWIARHGPQIHRLGATAQAVTASYERVRAGLVALQDTPGSPMRGDGLDGTIASLIYGNGNFITAIGGILVLDEYVADPGTAGVTAAHVERAWERLPPELQALTSLQALKGAFGVSDFAGTPSAVIERARADAAGAPPDAEVDLGAIGTVVRCNDTKWGRNPFYYLDEADRMTRRYPFFGYLNGVPLCSFWPYGAQDRDVDLRRSPRLLMITSELDPATAYEGALRTHRDTKHATRLVSIDDEGMHGQYIGSPSACAEQAGDAFIFDGLLPAADLVCGTSPLPAETSVFAVHGPVQGNAVPLPTRAFSTAETAAPNPLLEQIREEIASLLG